MYFLFSGEGITDLGLPKSPNSICDSNVYEWGPLVDLTDQIVTKYAKFSFLNQRRHGMVPKSILSQKSKSLHPAKKAPQIPGKKRKKETGYFFCNARALAYFANEKSTEINDTVLAVLFRDADGNAGNRGEWQAKWDSMIDGFQEEGYQHGIPMIPNPKSEAWFLCALMKYRNSNDNCAYLEQHHGSRHSPNPIKRQLAEFCGEIPSSETLRQWVKERKISADNIDLPSFNKFRERLEEVLQIALPKVNTDDATS